MRLNVFLCGCIALPKTVGEYVGPQKLLPPDVAVPTRCPAKSKGPESDNVNSESSLGRNSANAPSATGSNQGSGSGPGYIYMGPSQRTSSSRAVIGGVEYNSFFVNPLAEGPLEDGTPIAFAGAAITELEKGLHNPLAEEFGCFSTPPDSPCRCRSATSGPSAAWGDCGDLAAPATPSQPSATCDPSRDLLVASYNQAWKDMALCQLMASAGGEQQERPQDVGVAEDGQEAETPRLPGRDPAPLPAQQQEIEWGAKRRVSISDGGAAAGGQQQQQPFVAAPSARSLQLHAVCEEEANSRQSVGSAPDEEPLGRCAEVPAPLAGPAAESPLSAAACVLPSQRRAADVAVPTAQEAEMAAESPTPTTPVQPSSASLRSALSAGNAPRTPEQACPGHGEDAPLPRLPLLSWVVQPQPLPQEGAAPQQADAGAHDVAAEVKSQRAESFAPSTPPLLVSKEQGAVAPSPEVAVPLSCASVEMKLSVGLPEGPETAAAQTQDADAPAGEDEVEVEGAAAGQCAGPETADAEQQCEGPARRCLEAALQQVASVALAASAAAVGSTELAEAAADVPGPLAVDGLSPVCCWAGEELPVCVSGSLPGGHEPVRLLAPSPCDDCCLTGVDAAFAGGKADPSDSEALSAPKPAYGGASLGGAVMPCKAGGSFGGAVERVRAPLSTPGGVSDPTNDPGCSISGLAMTRTLIRQLGLLPGPRPSPDMPLVLRAQMQAQRLAGGLAASAGGAEKAGAKAHILPPSPFARARRAAAAALLPPTGCGTVAAVDVEVEERPDVQAGAAECRAAFEHGAALARELEALCGRCGCEEGLGGEEGYDEGFGCEEEQGGQSGYEEEEEARYSFVSSSSSSSSGISMGGGEAGPVLSMRSLQGWLEPQGWKPLRERYGGAVAVL